MSHRLMAALEFDTGRLRDFLQLPETAEIVSAYMDRNIRGRLVLVIEGAGRPTKEGECILRQTCMISQQQLADGTRLEPVLTWPFVEYPDQKVEL